MKSIVIEKGYYRVPYLYAIIPSDTDRNIHEFIFKNFHNVRTITYGNEYLFDIFSHIRVHQGICSEMKPAYYEYYKSDSF